MYTCQHIIWRYSGNKAPQTHVYMCVDTCVPSACYLCNICLRALFPQLVGVLFLHTSLLCILSLHTESEKQTYRDRESVHRNADVFWGRQTLAMYIGIELSIIRTHTAGVNTHMSWSLGATLSSELPQAFCSLICIISFLCVLSHGCWRIRRCPSWLDK